MDYVWIRKKWIRSFHHPSSRLFILLLTLLTGMWIGSSLNNRSVDHQHIIHEPASDKQQVTTDAMVKEETTLLILIMSAKPHREKRQACRTTWIQMADYRPFRHFFVIGGKGVDSMDMSQLMQENGTHSDLLILPDVPDSYAGLTHKLLSAMKSVADRFSFKFLLKVDDDSFVRLDLLMDEMSDMQSDRVYWGYFSGGAPVKKAGAWKESEWFMCDTYVPYAVGGGYVLSSDLVLYVASSSHLLQMYNSEDVSLGTWLSPLHIHRRHDVRFDTWYKSRGCSNEFLITHKQTPGLMQERYQALQTFGNLCKKEKFVVGYLYDWTVLPSHCCNKKESLTKSPIGWESI